MFQLTYISTARLQRHREDVEQILAASRRNNERDGITGLLVHDGIRFLQALEGSHSAVMETYRRIRADTRHRAPVILSKREVEERQFGTWAMAAEQVAAGPSGLSVPQIVDALVAQVRDLNTRALFSSFSRIDRRPAAPSAAI